MAAPSSLTGPASSLASTQVSLTDARFHPISALFALTTAVFPRNTSPLSLTDPGIPQRSPRFEHSEAPFRLTCAPLFLAAASAGATDMPDPKSPPLPLANAASLRENAAPVGHTGPSLSSSIAPFPANPGSLAQSPERNPQSPPSSSRATASPREADARVRVSPEVVRAFLARKETQDLIVGVVRRGLSKKTPRNIVDEIVSDANARAFTTKARPFRESRLPGWLTAVAVSARKDYFRAGAADLKWVNRQAEVDEVAADVDAGEVPADEGEEAAPTWLIGPWLEKKVAPHAADRDVYELLVDKAKSDKSYEEIAAERGETVNALTKRVQRFKAKYVPLRRRHNERRHALMLFLRLGGAVALVAAAVLLAYYFYRGVRPAPEPPDTKPSSSASPRPFDDNAPGVSHPPPPEN